MPQLCLLFLAVQFHHLPLHRLRRFAVRPSPAQPMPQCAIASRSPAYQQGPHPAHAKPELRPCLLLGDVPFLDRHPQPLFRFRHALSKRNFLLCGKRNFSRCGYTPHVLLDIRFLFAHNRPMAITRRQRELYDFISRFVAEKGYSPSFEEIAEGLGLSSLATVHKHVSNLEKKGLLTRDYNRSRSIDLVAPKGKLKQSMAVNTGLVLPVLGRIAAGRPIEAVEQRDGNTISLADFVRSKEVFVLEVRGESMQDEHIMDGDYVLVEKTKVGRNGDLVVALVNGDESTLKRFYKEGDKVRLQPSNASMQPIIVPATAVELQGKVIGVLRKY